MDAFQQFSTIWLVDFEFGQPDGELPEVRCMVAREYRSRRLIRLWIDGDDPPDCPIDTDESSLFVAHLATAELNCFRSLGWELAGSDFRICTWSFVESQTDESCRTVRGCWGHCPTTVCRRLRQRRKSDFRN